MRLNEPHRAKRSISLTPLIDVVFLLLVFFMLASTFLKFGTVRLETAGAGAGVTDPATVVLVHIDGERRYKVNGIPVESEGLARAVDRLIAKGAREAVVIVRQKAAVDDLLDAVRRLRRSRVSSVRIVE